MTHTSQHIPRRMAIWVDHRMAILVTFAGERFRKAGEILSDASQHLQDEEDHEHPYHWQAHQREHLGIFTRRSCTIWVRQMRF